LHLGDDVWAIIDSCRNGSNAPAALEYLESVGVDAARDVRYVVATHWHDDHVGGLAEIVNECVNAVVFLPAALTVPEFLAFMKLDRPEPVGNLAEMTNVVAIVDKRARKRKDRPAYRPYSFVSEGKPLHNVQYHQQPCTQTALSPSTEDATAFLIAFGRWLRRHGNAIPTEIPKFELNHTSIVLHVKSGGKVMLLGADRQQLKSPGRGWNSVLATFQALGLVRASIYKVAHHGAANGDDELIWEELCVANPLAVVTPFRRGLQGGQPRRSDIGRLLSRTASAWSTALPQGDVDMTSEPVLVFHDVALLLDEIEVEDAQLELGQVRFRGPRDDVRWTVEVMNGAGRLTSAHC
jgi:hypothetical protein